MKNHYIEKMKNCDRLAICERKAATFLILKEAFRSETLTQKQESYLINLRNRLLKIWGLSR